MMLGGKDWLGRLHRGKNGGHSDRRGKLCRGTPRRRQGGSAADRILLQPHQGVFLRPFLHRRRQQSSRRTACRRGLWAPGGASFCVTARRHRPRRSGFTRIPTSRLTIERSSSTQIEAAFPKSIGSRFPGPPRRPEHPGRRGLSRPQAHSLSGALLEAPLFPPNIPPNRESLRTVPSGKANMKSVVSNSGDETVS